MNDRLRAYIAESYELAGILTKSRDKAIRNWKYLSQLDKDFIADWGDQDDFSTKCTQVIHSLLIPGLEAFGTQAGRSLSCTRPIIADAATNCLGIYDGERPRPRVPKPNTRALDDTL
jgi:hypothetical protein